MTDWTAPTDEMLVDYRVEDGIAIIRGIDASRDYPSLFGGRMGNIRRRRGSGGFQPPFPRSRRLEATATANVYSYALLNS